MALLDSLFDPSSFGGDNLLSRLLPSVRNPYQPSEGFGPPQGQAPAIPPDTLLSANRQPPQVPIQQVTQPGNAAPAFLQQGGALDNVLGNLGSSNSLIGGLFGALRGGLTGQRFDPQGIALQNQRAQYQATMQALIANGEDPQRAQSMAMLSVLNPEAAKTVLPEMLTNKQKLTVLHGAFGDVPYWSNERTQEMVPALKEGAPGFSGNDMNAMPGDITKTGEDYISSLPKQFQGIVRGFVEGTAPMPKITTKNQQAMQMYFDMAKQADPSFDAANYGARQKGMNSFKSGADAATVKSANQVLGHISDLADYGDALHNRSFTPWNKLANAADTATGGAAAKNWLTQAHAVADEMSAFMKGSGHNSDTEIKQWLDSLSPDMSPTQQRGALKVLMGIYDHALQALEDKRAGSVGPMAAQKMGPLLTPSGQAAKEKINKWVESGKESSQNKPQRVTQNGHVYELQPDGSYK